MQMSQIKALWMLNESCSNISSTVNWHDKKLTECNCSLTEALQSISTSQVQYVNETAQSWLSYCFILFYYLSKKFLAKAIQQSMQAGITYGVAGCMEEKSPGYKKQSPDSERRRWSLLTGNGTQV